MKITGECTDDDILKMLKKGDQPPNLVEQRVIKPDDCCHLCKGGWCTGEMAALTCKDALLPDDFGETVDHSGVGCQRAL